MAQNAQNIKLPNDNSPLNLDPTERLDFILAISMDTRLKDWDAKVAAVVMSFRNNKTGACFPSHKAIAKRAGLSVTRVQRSLTRLIDFKWIVITHRAANGGLQTSNQYDMDFKSARSFVTDRVGHLRHTGSVTSDVPGRSFVTDELSEVNSVNQPSESNTRNTSASGGGPADPSDRRLVNDYESRYLYDDETGPEYQPGGKWYEMDHNPLGELNLRNEYQETFGDWSGSDRPENLTLFMEVRRSGVDFDRLISAAREVDFDGLTSADKEVDREVSLQEFLAGAWKHFDPFLVKFDDTQPDREAGSDIDWDNDPPF